MLETYIKFHISRKGYEPTEEQKLKKFEEYRKKIVEPVTPSRRFAGF